jgi:hypothetical protein
MRHFSAGRLPKGNHPIVGFFFDSPQRAHTLVVCCCCVRSPVAINSFIYCQVSLLCVCVPDPVIDEFASAPFWNLSSPQVLLGICQGYSIRIDWLLIDGAWRKLPFPYIHRLPPPPVECRGKRPCTRPALDFLMDWRSRTVVGHGSAPAMLGDRHSCLVMCHAHYLARSPCVLSPTRRPNNNQHNKWSNMSCVLYGIIEFFFLFWLV